MTFTRYGDLLSLNYFLIRGATNLWCTAKPTITAASTTKNCFPVSFVNISFILKVYETNLLIN